MSRQGRPALLAAIMTMYFPIIGTAQNTKLSWILSPQTKKHVALQPRDDHHRLCFLVRIVGGGGERFEATLECNASPQITQDSVEFIALKDDQTWAITLCTPKRLNEDARYLLRVRQKRFNGAGNGADPESTLVYGWTIKRRPDNKAEIILPPSGGRSEFHLTTSAAVKEANAAGPIWKIVNEVKTLTFYVPTGFVFGVDSTGSFPNFNSAEPVD